MTAAPDDALPDAAALRALPEAERRARIEQADHERADGALTAQAVYCALALDLDPGSAADAERVRWLAWSELPPVDGLEGLMQRASLPTTDSATRAAAHVVLAGFSLDRQEQDEALYLLRTALRESRGTASPTEAAACVEYAALCAGQGAMAEALLLVHRAQRALGDGGSPSGRARAEVTLCGVLRTMGRFREFAEACLRAEDRVAALPPGPASTLERVLLLHRADVASETGDTDAALDLCSRLEQHSSGKAHEQRWFAAFRANVRLREERHEDALELVTLARSLADGPDPLDLFLDAVELRAAARAGRIEDARSRGPDLLDRLEQRRGGATNATQILLTSDLARTFESPCADPDLTRRALNLATGAAARRLVELERAARDIQRLDFMVPEDVMLLAPIRAAFDDGLRGLVQTAASALERVGAAAGRPAEWLFAPRGLVRLCPWCSRVGIPEFAWVPLERYLEQATQVDLTHAVCHDCFDRLQDAPETAPH
jgi:hypothetical protein